MEKEDLPLILEHLSNIELYYFPQLSLGVEELILDGEEVHHAMGVMRNEVGGKIFATNGLGNLFSCEILSKEKKSICVKSILAETRTNLLSNIYFCIPNLKSSDRLEFALEKLVEMGFVNFVFFKGERSIYKNKRVNLERLDKIAVSAMKQSLNLWKPNLIIDENLNQIDIENGGENIYYLDISCHDSIEVINGNSASTKNKYLVFGPEGGLSNEELIRYPNKRGIRLSQTRLRSETAMVYAGSLLSNYLIKS